MLQIARSYTLGSSSTVGIAASTLSPPGAPAAAGDHNFDLPKFAIRFARRNKTVPSCRGRFLVASRPRRGPRRERGITRRLERVLPLIPHEASALWTSCTVCMIGISALLSIR